MSDSESQPVTIGNWILTFILLAIPLVNLIMLIVWAVGGTTHPSKKTFAQAYLILFAILFCIGLVAALILPILAHHHVNPGT